MNLAETVTCYREALVRLVYPAHCGACRAFLELEEKGICGPCAERLRALRFSLEDAAVDGNFTQLDSAWTLYPYESPVKEMIAAIKFQRKRWLARTFKEAIGTLAAALTAEVRYDALVPVPLDRAKLVEREFNQSEILAHLVEQAAGIPVARRILRKSRSIPSQSLLGRTERLANPYGSFRVSGRADLEGKNFLIVDDIFTTGATAEEAARVLKQRGAKRVDLFALARTELK